MLCGLVGGVSGGTFARLLAKGIAGTLPAIFRHGVHCHPIITAFILGLILTALGVYTQGQTYGTGYHVVTQALDGEVLQPDIGIMKLFATVGSYWTGIAGGIFTPSLTIGAGLGVQVASFSDGLIDQRLLVLLCMAAFLAGATQSPVTASVIVMEMTGCQPVLIWLLICCLISSIISRQFSPKPFYHFAAGRFRHRIQEEIQKNRKESS